MYAVRKFPVQTYDGTNGQELGPPYTGRVGTFTFDREEDGTLYYADNEGNEEVYPIGSHFVDNWWYTEQQFNETFAVVDAPNA